ncbi:MAG: TRAP transporter substrate-binding protein [Rhizobiales bacterium]|nr:TRAP transporter substrate-binding protein [Hyphomicrobiales bacterium]
MTKKNQLSRRQFVAVGAASAAGASVLAKPAVAAGNIEWRMVTSWPKDLPGPGVTARRLVERINVMSAGRLKIRLYSASELVPALEVFDAVSNGLAEMAHTAALFWGGKMSAAPFFTAVPFGLAPIEHITWIEHGGGQALWDELYAPFKIKPFMAGNTGFQMGGWYKKPVNSLEDLKGLKIRMPGLGGKVMKRLGATPLTLAPSDILPALQSGVIDATEFLGPFSDMAMGFHRAAKHYYWPGFHEPNGTGEALISVDAWNALDDQLKAMWKMPAAQRTPTHWLRLNGKTRRRSNALLMSFRSMCARTHKRY